MKSLMAASLFAVSAALFAQEFEPEPDVAVFAKLDARKAPVPAGINLPAEFAKPPFDEVFQRLDEAVN